MSFDISRPYVLIPSIKALTEDLRQLENHAQFIGTEGHKKQYELTIAAVKSACKLFSDTSAKAYEEKFKLEEELKQYSDFLP